MVRLAAALLFVLGSLAAAVELGAPVTAWTAAGEAIYLGAEDGRVLRYLPEEDAVTEVWRLPLLELVTGPLQPKLYSLDARGDELLWVREGAHGFRVIERFREGGAPEVVLDETAELPVMAAWFLAPDRVVAVLLDGEVVWVDAAGRVERRLQVTRSAVGAAAKHGTLLAVGDEGGLVTLMDLEGARILGQAAMHRDKVLALTLGERWALSGGRDRRAAAWALEGTTTLALRAEFFVYAVALDAEERLAAYTYDESGTLRIVDLVERREVRRASGFEGVDRLMFWGEDCLVVADEYGRVRCWRWR
ncbi:WD40 repeat domain-containing protein [Oceanithermus sp.]